MKTVAIIAPTGMLGNAVYRELKDRYSLILVVRDKNKLTLLDKQYGGVDDHTIVPFLSDELYKEYLDGDKVLDPSMGCMAVGY